MVRIAATHVVRALWMLFILRRCTTFKKRDTMKLAIDMSVAKKIPDMGIREAAAAPRSGGAGDPS